MAMTALRKCDCNDDYQDKKYGKGYRLCNQMKTAKGMPLKWRCTICGKEKYD